MCGKVFKCLGIIFLSYSGEYYFSMKTKVLSSRKIQFLFGENMNGVSIMQPLTKLFEATVNFLPKLAASLVLITTGIIVGWLFGRITKEILRRLKIDRRLKLPERGLLSTEGVFPPIVNWGIFLLFLQEALMQLGIVVLTSFLQELLSFIVGLIMSAIVIVVGYLLGNYLATKIKETKTKYSEIVGSVVLFLIVYIAVALSLPFICIGERCLDPFIINSILLIMLGSIGLGLAIAIGLGLKDVIAVMVKKYLRKLG